METMDYSLFKFFESNREVRPSKIKDLKESITAFGYLPNSLILVDTNFFIIDGQHRFLACLALKLPIKYAISSDTVDSHKAMIKLNSTQTQWRGEDYITSYAKQGVKSHALINQVMQMYNFGTSTAIAICLNNITGNYPALKSGQDLAINEGYQDVIKFILKSKESLPFYAEAKFVRAVSSLYRQVDIKTFNKVADRIGVLKKQVSHADYLMCFENLINKYRKSGDNIHLSI